MRGPWVSVDVACRRACGWGVPSPRPTAQSIGGAPGGLCERTRPVAGHGMAPDTIVVHLAPGLAATGNVPVIDSAAISTPCGHRWCQNVSKGLRMALRGSWEYLRVMAPRRYAPATRDREASRHGWAEDPESPGPLAILPICDFPGPGVLWGTPL